MHYKVFNLFTKCPDILTITIAKKIFVLMKNFKLLVWLNFFFFFLFLYRHWVICLDISSCLDSLRASMFKCD